MSGQEYSLSDRIFGSSNNSLPYGFTPSPPPNPAAAYNNYTPYQAPHSPFGIDHLSRDSTGRFDWMVKESNPSKYL